MAQLRNGMRALTLDALTPAETMTKLNRLLESYTDAPFATLAFLASTPTTHDGDDRPRPGTRRRSSSRPTGRRGSSRGTAASRSASTPDVSYTEHTAQLAAGTIVVLYTDGLVERRGPLDRRGARPARARPRPAPRASPTRSSTRSSSSSSAARRCRTTSRCSRSTSTRRSLAPLELTFPAGPRRRSRSSGASSSAGSSPPRCRRSTRVTSSSRHGRPAPTRSSTRGAGEGAGRRAWTRRYRATGSGSGSIDVAAGRSRGAGRSRARPAADPGADDERRRRAQPGGTRVVMERPLTREPARRPWHASS